MLLSLQDKSEQNEMEQITTEFQLTSCNTSPSGEVNASERGKSNLFESLLTEEVWAAVTELSAVCAVAPGTRLSRTDKACW